MTRLVSLIKGRSFHSLLEKRSVSATVTSLITRKARSLKRTHTTPLLLHISISKCFNFELDKAVVLCLTTAHIMLSQGASTSICLHAKGTTGEEGDSSSKHIHA